MMEYDLRGKGGILKLDAAAVQELMPAFVLGALDSEELMAVDDYLQEQRDLLVRLEQLDEVTAQLAYVAPAQLLASKVKEQLLERARQDVANSGPPVQATNPFNAPASTARIPAFVTQQILPQGNQPPAVQPLRRLSTRPQPATAPARNWFGFVARTIIASSAAAAIILLILSTVQLRNKVDQLAAQISTSQQQVSLLESEKSQFQQINQQLQAQLDADRKQFAFYSQAEQVVTLTGTKDAPGARAEMYFSADQAQLVLHGLPPLPDTQTYQLWYIPTNAAPVPADLLTVRPDQNEAIALTVPPEQRNFAAIGITIEPAGGSPVPTLLVLQGSAT